MLTQPHGAYNAVASERAVTVITGLFFITLKTRGIQLYLNFVIWQRGLDYALLPWMRMDF